MTPEELRKANATQEALIRRLECRLAATERRAAREAKGRQQALQALRGAMTQPTRDDDDIWRNLVAKYSAEIEAGDEG